MIFSLTLSEIKDLLIKHNLLITSNIKDSDLSTEINFLTYNSKEVSKGSLFICKGVHFKKEYFDEAKSKGFTCYVSEEIYDSEAPFFQVNQITKALSLLSIAFFKNPSDTFKLIGVTGTAGKTTTAYMIHSIANTAAGKETGLISTNETYCGDEHKEAENTTPESLKLQELFSEARRNKLPFVTMEVSSQAYSVNRVYGQEFDIGIFMNIDKDHVGGPEHPSYEHYLACKLEFIKHSKTMLVYARTRELDKIIATAKKSNCKLVIFDLPDEIAFAETNSNQKIASNDLSDIGDTSSNIPGAVPAELIFTPSPSKEDLEATLGREITYYTATDIKLHGDKGFSFFLNGNEYSCDMSGRFNVINAIAAVVTGLELNLPIQTIKEGIRHVYVPGRMNISKIAKTTIIVDYAHNRLTLFEFLKSCASDYPNAKLNIVIGAAGKNHLRRDDIAGLCSEYADYIYITDEDPDFENPIEICSDIARRIPKGEADYEIIVNRAEAIEKAIIDAVESDNENVVAILGKGCERFVKIKGKHVACDSDSDVVKRVLDELDYNPEDSVPIIWS